MNPLIRVVVLVVMFSGANPTVAAPRTQECNTQFGEFELNMPKVRMHKAVHRFLRTYRQALLEFARAHPSALVLFKDRRLSFLGESIEERVNIEEPIRFSKK